jgi:hypothetical protein
VIASSAGAGKGVGVLDISLTLGHGVTLVVTLFAAC